MSGPQVWLELWVLWELRETPVLKEHLALQVLVVLTEHLVLQDRLVSLAIRDSLDQQVIPDQQDRRARQDFRGRWDRPVTREPRVQWVGRGRVAYLVTQEPLDNQDRTEPRVLQGNQVLEETLV